MKKLKIHSPNFTEENIARLAELFPNCVTEAQEPQNTQNTQKEENNNSVSSACSVVKKVIDWDLLKQELSEHIVEGAQERYHLNWPGKREALLTANKPIAGTLRPCRQESVDFDTTENLFIEGDNLEALKLLQETYLGKVKMIYIDPPYNTGKDFIYKDNFRRSAQEELEESGQVDEEGNRLVANTDSNGRFHSDWLSMMYPRLKLARNLLSDDGVIFISIDDNEVSNLRKMCDEVFGEENFVNQLVWEKKKKGTFLSNTITSVKEYVFVYAKYKYQFSGLIGEINSNQETYPCVNAPNKREVRRIPPGIESKSLEKNHFLPKGSTILASTMDLVLHSDLVIKNGFLAEELVIEGNWRYRQDLMEEYALNRELYITQGLSLRRIVNEPRKKTLKDLLLRVGEDKESTHKSLDINNLFADGWGSNEDGEEELRQLLEAKGLMDFPKPRKLIEKLCVSIRDTDAIVLDFFAGSGTTAHAVMHLNSLDKGNRKFILAQLPEFCDDKTEAFKAGYSTIAEICKERIRRAGKQLKIKGDENNSQLDTGFRVLKIDSSNMTNVYYTPDATKQAELGMLTDNIKPGRSSEDLLFQVLLDWGVDLSLPIAREKWIMCNGKPITTDGDNTQHSNSSIEVFFVDGNALAACFEKEGKITEDFCKELAKRYPLRVVFRDSGFRDDSVKINVEQIFKLISPHTDVKSI